MPSRSIHVERWAIRLAIDCMANTTDRERHFICNILFILRVHKISRTNAHSRIPNNQSQFFAALTGTEAPKESALSSFSPVVCQVGDQPLACCRPALDWSRLQFCNLIFSVVLSCAPAWEWPSKYRWLPGPCVGFLAMAIIVSDPGRLVVRVASPPVFLFWNHIGRCFSPLPLNVLFLWSNLA